MTWYSPPIFTGNVMCNTELHALIWTSSPVGNEDMTAFIKVAAYGIKSSIGCFDSYSREGYFYFFAL